MRTASSWLAMALALAWPLAAAAQSTTIAPDVGGARGLGTTVAQTGRVFAVDGGTLAGANLFHSFSQFSLGAGDTASWTRAAGDAGAVRNVINRVTGGLASQIAGTIDSTGLPNASFYFINPAGVVFGAGARVNVPAAAYFSTAGELRFADSARFAVATPGGSTLSMAAPEAFGFVGGQGAIRLDGVSETFAPANAALSFTAADVSVAGGKFAVRGLDLIGVGSGSATVSLADPLAVARAGQVNVTGSQLIVTAAGVASGALRIGGGDVTLDATTLVSDTAEATRGGDIRIAADQLRLVNAPLLSSTSRGSGAGGDVVVSSRSIQGDSGLVLTSSSADGAGGRLSLTGGDISLTNVTIASNGTGSGAAGDVEITADTLAMDTAFAIASTFGSGAGGAVRLTAAQMDLGGALAFASAYGTGTPGDVVVKGDRISSNGSSFGSAPGLNSPSGNLSITATASLEAFGGSFTAVAYNDNSAGSITISAPKIFLQQTFFDVEAIGNGAVGVLNIRGDSVILDRSQIAAASRGVSGANGGLVQITAASDLLVNLSQISSNAESGAPGGAIAIDGGKVTFTQSQITADSNGDGRAGQVSVKADTLLISNSQVSSNSVVSGDAGDVTLEARQINLDTAAEVTSETRSFTGNAGSVTIKGGKLVLEDSRISSLAMGGTGHAGTVTVVTDSVSLKDSVISSDAQSLGDAGNVTVRTGDLQLLGNGNFFTSISSDTFSVGNAGNVTIVAKTMVVQDQAFVSSDAVQGSFGNAGTVSIDAGSLKVLRGSFVASDSFGDGRAGNVLIRADSLTVDASDTDKQTYISSDTLGGGNAGTVKLDVGALNLVHGGFVSSTTYTGAQAGDVVITARSIALQDFGLIGSQAFPGSGGDAGIVSISADSLSVGANSVISTATGGEGNAGTVTIVAKTLTVDGGVLSSAAAARATGASNAVTVTADTVTLLNGGSISTESSNASRAGQINLTAGALLIDGMGSGISSENKSAGRGDAGGVTITSDNITVANGGRISTNAVAGAAGEIRLTMSPGALLTLQGADQPGSIETSSGAGTGGKITIAAPLAIISNGGSILALGERRGANVVIQTGFFINSADRANTVAVDGEFRLEAGVDDVSSGTVSRDLSVLDASKVLRGQCPVARSTGVLSQLITRPVGPYAREPSIQTPSAPPGRVQFDLGGCP